MQSSTVEMKDSSHHRNKGTYSFLAASASGDFQSRNHSAIIEDVVRGTAPACTSLRTGGVVALLVGVSDRILDERHLVPVCHRPTAADAKHPEVTIPFITRCLHPVAFTAARNLLSSLAFIVDRIGVVDVRQQKLIFTYGRGAFELAR